MPLMLQKDVEYYIDSVPRDDPEVRARGRWIIQRMLKGYPEVRQELVEEGALRPLVHLFERRLGRPLTDNEGQSLRERFKRLGADRLSDVVLDLPPEALAAWLSDPAAV